MTTWTAPVRYAEVDPQGVVFNSNYLLYCDEAMSLFCRERGLVGLAESVQLKATALTWTSAARWGEAVTVLATCQAVGRTSFRIAFDIEAGDRPCCRVQTTYVLVGTDGRPAPLAEHDRAQLRAGA